MPSPEQELLRLAQLDIGLSVALASDQDGQATANLRANQKVIQERMRLLQTEISRNRKQAPVPRQPFLAESRSRPPEDRKEKGLVQDSNRGSLELRAPVRLSERPAAMS
jgi:hypothetical protein